MFTILLAVTVYGLGVLFALGIVQDTLGSQVWALASWGLIVAMFFILVAIVVYQRLTQLGKISCNALNALADRVLL